MGHCGAAQGMQDERRQERRAGEAGLTPEHQRNRAVLSRLPERRLALAVTEKEA